MLWHMSLVRTYVSEDFSASIMMGVLSSSETSVLTRATRRNIREDAILRSQLRENLKSYISDMLSSLLTIEQLIYQQIKMSLHEFRHETSNKRWKSV
jgi:hypothetical protein